MEQEAEGAGEEGREGRGASGAHAPRCSMPRHSHLAVPVSSHTCHYIVCLYRSNRRRLVSIIFCARCRRIIGNRAFPVVLSISLWLGGRGKTAYDANVLFTLRLSVLAIARATAATYRDSCPLRAAAISTAYRRRVSAPCHRYSPKTLLRLPPVPLPSAVGWPYACAFRDHGDAWLSYILT